jgi:hypothetical protein
VFAFLEPMDWIRQDLTMGTTVDRWPVACGFYPFVLSWSGTVFTRAIVQVAKKA